ncbi:hypothetical protein LV82_01708 [Albidovulum inexpectatum]|uniref:Uncharacterized protein n=1 Tax=Albidovulum inexpectatum TaxID=196587 RepID=A0A2S5JI71_9RHOB|nr:hypothetical protein [Albidovulum inexpectatum]PPB80975.1 hypothetical protein LV82_01708 [Albidovulum inexpectatum]
MSTLESVKLYGRVTLLRRRVLLQQLVRRAMAAAIAVLAFVAAIGMATFALFVAIAPSLGTVGASLTIAAIYLALAILLLLYSLREPNSAELQALEEAEAAALEMLAHDAQEVVQVASAASHRISDLGSNLGMAVAILTALRRLLGARRGGNGTGS